MYTVFYLDTLERILTSLEPARTIIVRTSEPKMRHPTKLKLACRVDINKSSNRTYIIPSNTTMFPMISDGSFGNGGRYIR